MACEISDGGRGKGGGRGRGIKYEFTIGGRSKKSNACEKVCVYPATYPKAKDVIFWIRFNGIQEKYKYKLHIHVSY